MEKVININELRKRKNVKNKIEINTNDPTMNVWLKGISVGYYLNGDEELKMYFLRGLELGFETNLN